MLARLPNALHQPRLPRDLNFFRNLVFGLFEIINLINPGNHRCNHTNIFAVSGENIVSLFRFKIALTITFAALSVGQIKFDGRGSGRSGCQTPSLSIRAISETTNPGCNVVQLTPVPINSTCKVRPIECTAAFEAPYAPKLGLGRYAPTLPTKPILPLFFFKCGRAYLTVKAKPVTLTCNCLFQSLAVSFSIFPKTPKPGISYNYIQTAPGFNDLLDCIFNSSFFHDITRYYQCFPT